MADDDYRRREVGSKRNSLKNVIGRHSTIGKKGPVKLPYDAPKRDLGVRAGFDLDCGGRLLARLDELEQTKRR